MSSVVPAFVKIIHRNQPINFIVIKLYSLLASEGKRHHTRQVLHRIPCLDVLWCKNKGNDTSRYRHLNTFCPRLTWNIITSQLLLVSPEGMHNKFFPALRSHFTFFLQTKPRNHNPEQGLTQKSISNFLQ